MTWYGGSTNFTMQMYCNENQFKTFSRNLFYIQIRSIHSRTSYYDHVLKFVEELYKTSRIVKLFLYHPPTTQRCVSLHVPIHSQIQ